MGRLNEWRGAAVIGWLAGAVRRFRRDRRGVLAVELAIAMPVVAGLLLSGIEVSRFVLLNQKIERATATMADLVSQAEILTGGDLNNYYSAARFVMQPYDLSVKGKVIVSSISAAGGNPAQINWQRAYGAGAGSSAYGMEGGNAAFPSGFLIRDGETVIVAEIFYSYRPLLVEEVMKPVSLYNHAIFRPRFSSLASLAP